MKKNFGHYYGGNGEVHIAEGLVLTDNHPGADLIRTVAHEFAHHEQNNLIIWRLAEQLESKLSSQAAPGTRIKIDANSSKPIKSELQEAYRARVGNELSEKFLDSVLGLRDRNLTEGEKKRADALISSQHELRETLIVSARINEITEKLNRYIPLFSKNLSIDQLLYGKGDQRLGVLSRILGVNELPDEIVQKFKQFEQAQKDGSPSVGKLDTGLRELLKEVFIATKDLLAKREFGSYRDRLHEEEAYRVGARANLFAGMWEVHRKNQTKH